MESNFVKLKDKLGSGKQKARHSACKSSYLRNGARYDQCNFMALV